eukprot:g6223.t1
MSDQPQYYRVTDSLENLSVRIRLRKIFGRSVNANATANANSVRSRREDQHQHAATKVPGSFVPGDEADIRVKWQEKIFGPGDIVALSSAQRRGGKPQQHRTVPRLERNYAGHLEDLRRDGVDPLGSISEVMLFTYTDKDGFIPPSDSADGSAGGRSKLTTGDGGPHSYLEEAVANMPRRAATSSVMYIMAAVDVDVREVAKAAKARAAASGGSRWKRGEDDVGVHVHEQVVCSIKAHQNGTLEIAPGFSAEEPESGDEGAFLTDHTVKVMDKEGARLTTYRFTSPSGGVFSYTVENDSEPGGGVEEMETWEAEEASRDMWKKASRQQTAGTQLLGAPATGGAVALHAFMEIVSASGFMGADCLYTEYALCLPRHWIMAANEDGGGGGRTNSGLDHGFEGVARGIYRESGDFAAGGTTQVARQAYPLTIPHRCARTSATTTTTTKNSTSGSLGYGSSSSPTPPLANTYRYGSSTMPSTFQDPRVKMVASGAALRIGSAVFLCLLGLLGSLGESPLFCVAFGGAVVVVAALSGGGGGGAGGEGGEPVAHFGFPAEFHLVNEEEGEMAGIGERPQVLLTVSSLDSLARHRVEGYGYVAFPRQPGAHELLVRTWRPLCSLRTHLQDFFVGGAHRLHDPRYASKPGSFKGTFLSRFGFRTETSGTLRVRLHLAEQGRVRDSHGESGEEGAGPSIDLAGTRTVKEILRVVNAKRMGVEIGRRFSATLNPASAAAAPSAPAAPPGSAAPAATAPVASSSNNSRTGKATQRQNASGGGGGDLAFSLSATTMPLSGSRNPFEKVVEGDGVKGGKVEAAADLLARVKDQLESL